MNNLGAMALVALAGWATLPPAAAWAQDQDRPVHRWASQQRTLAAPVDPALDPTSTCDQGACGKAQWLIERQRAGLPIGEGPVNPFQTREALGDTDLLTVDLDIDVNPVAPGFISGSNEMRVRSLVNGLSEFTFMLRSNFTISQILVDDVAIPSASIPVPPANSYARRTPLGRTVNAGEEFKIKVFYSGVPVSRGFGSIDFRTQNGVPIVSTLSQAYFAGTWWPVKDGDVFAPGDNSDKSTGRIAITVPQPLEAVSNGRLEGVDTLPDNKRRFRWRTDYPTATYLYCFAATDYSQWSINYTYPLPGGGTGTMPIEFSLYAANDTPTNRAAWEVTRDMLAAYRGVYGEYPFVNEKYGMYQFPFSGGMEHQTYTGQNVSASQSVTAHELAHQWWGNLVTCKTWNHIWLNEGFATYGEAIWQERRPGSTGLPALRDAMNARRPSNNVRTLSVYVPSATDMSRLFNYESTYERGAWTLHMLRKELGDTAFYAGLALFRQAFANSGATTDDFRIAMETASGRDLSTFFQQWVFAIGWPDLALGTQNVLIDGQHYTRVSLRQTQTTDQGISGVFSVPIDLRVTSGASQTTRTVRLAARTQHYLIPTAAPATLTEADPSDWVLCNKASEAYVPGPAKVVSVAPALGAVLTPAQAPASIAVRFSEAVQGAASVTLTRAGSSVPATFTLTDANTRGVLTPLAPLTPGTYTVSIGGLTTTASGLALDGEVIASALPSGDGLPGGAASWSFTIQGAACDSTDFNQDGDFPTPLDLEDFINANAGNVCGSCSTDLDFNNDGDFPTPLDVEAFISVLGGGVCL